MVLESPHPRLVLPECNVLDYLFPSQSAPPLPSSCEPALRPNIDENEPILLDVATPETQSLTAGQMQQWVKRFGYGLEKLGVKRGEVVLVYTPNHIYVPVAYMGTVAAGRVFSGANPAYKQDELAYQLSNTSAQVLLVHPSLIQTATVAATKAGLATNRIFLFDDVRKDPINGIRDWRDMIGTPSEASTYQWLTLSPSEARKTVATVNYSSGTTGLPKGVCVTHANLIANTAQIIYMRTMYKERPLPKERWVMFLPLYHAYGQMYAVMLAIKLRASVYVMKSFDFGAFLQTLQDCRITDLQIAPPIAVLLAKRPEPARFDLSSLREISCGAAPLSRELAEEVSSRFNVIMQQGYGMTELTCAALTNPGGKRVHDTGSVGQLIPNTEGKLLADDGREVGPDEPGELYLRGPNVCLGYWRNEQATRETLSADGWLRTGDIAVERNGFFWIVDRKKELIKVKGLQVAPAELEAVLLESPHVADAAVTGVQVNEQEYPRAYVVLKDAARGRVSEGDLQAWIATKVAPHKCLTGGVAFVDVVPKLQSGKIMRKVMREWAKRDAEGVGKTVRAKL
ncbi:4-coumarate-CoA ligase [Phyllosticta citrichinensis]|uniref:4-coumarate-CoA ligase n=1 Tax=Phyllosticta citrichinensis TaxID=1130410 RepID=A0ABR1XSF7_9PEZI